MFTVAHTVGAAHLAVRELLHRTNGRVADVRADYESACPTYDEYYSTNLKRATTAFVDAIPKISITGTEERPIRIVELAAGTGAVTRKILGLSDYQDYTAVDISPGMTDISKKKSAATCRQVDYRVQDAVDYLTELPSASVDTLVCAWGICYFNRSRIRDQMLRVLKPETGHACIIENRADTLHEVNQIFRHVLFEDPTALRSAVAIRLPRSADSLYRDFFGKRRYQSVKSADSSSASTFKDPSEVVEYLVRSGASAGYLDALRPEKRDDLLVKLESEIEKVGIAKVPVVHRYAITIVRKS